MKKLFLLIMIMELFVIQTFGVSSRVKVLGAVGLGSLSLMTSCCSVAETQESSRALEVSKVQYAKDINVLKVKCYKDLEKILNSWSRFLPGHECKIDELLIKFDKDCDELDARVAQYRKDLVDSNLFRSKVKTRASALVMSVVNVFKQ